MSGTASVELSDRPRSAMLADLVEGSLLTVAYVILARFGFTMHPVNAFASLVWAPTGLSLAALLLMGNRFWPSIALGAVIANLRTGAPLPVALGIGAGNTLEEDSPEYSWPRARRKNGETFPSAARPL